MNDNVKINILYVLILSSTNGRIGWKQLSGYVYGWMDREMTRTDDENNLTFSSTNNQPMTIDLDTTLHMFM